MSTTIVYAEIRARCPFIINGIRLAAEQVNALMRFPSREQFDHFRANFGWDAFAVVEVDEKVIKADTLAAAAAVTVDQLGGMDDMREVLADAQAEIKAANRRIYDLQAKGRDTPAVIAGLTAAHLGFLDQAIADQVIQAAKRVVAERDPKPEQPAGDPVELARQAAMAELMTIDGIGEATAVRLHDHYKVTALHRLVAVLADEKGCATLIADPEAQISEKDLEHWRRQVGEPAQAGS